MRSLDVSRRADWFASSRSRDELAGPAGRGRVRCRECGALGLSPSVEPAVVGVPREAAPVALGELHHEVGGVAIEAEHVAREVEFASGPPRSPRGARAGRICTGSPTATQPIGTTVSGGSTVRRCTTALMRTSLRSPIRAPLKTRVPVARNTSSPIVAPETLAIGPTSVWSPMCTALAELARISAFSITMTFSPSVIGAALGGDHRTVEHLAVRADGRRRR